MNIYIYIGLLYFYHKYHEIPITCPHKRSTNSFKNITNISSIVHNLNKKSEIQKIEYFNQIYQENYETNDMFNELGNDNNGNNYDNDDDNADQFWVM